MRRALPKSRILQRLLLGVFLVYLFGVLGYLGTSHRHADGDRGADSHSSCQLCQVSHQPYAAPEAPVCIESPAVPVGLVQALWAPILASRYSPSASRAPPSA
jgi:hypothetical protein